jgi:hypothetical protein
MSNNNLITILGVSAVLFCSLLGCYIVSNHQESELVKQSLVKKQNETKEMEKRRDFEAKKAQEFERFYAGKVQAYNSIMGRRNLISNLRIRSRSEIESDVYRLRSEIAAIRAKYTTVGRTTYYNSSGNSVTVLTVSEALTAMNNELGNKPYDLMIAEAELKRDDYFTGRIAGKDL